jgi:protein TonB
LKNPKRKKEVQSESFGHHVFIFHSYHKPMNTTYETHINPETERFAVALFIAALVHLIAIYGIGFTMPKSAQLLNTTMEVILVQKSTDDIPKNADFLAQVNYQGGGESEQKVRPSTPTIAPFPDESAEMVFTPPPPQLAMAPKKDQIEILTTDKSAPNDAEQQQEMTEPEEPAEQGNADQTTELEEYATENTLFINALAVKLASLQAELNDEYQEYAKRPRKTFINSSTREYKYARYMDSWRRKVERIGNINYPDKARRERISGSLILDVALNPNGTVHKVEIKHPSKSKILDEAALRIVRLAAPFDPFPENIRKATDILHITRTWEFRYNNLTSR